MFRYDLYGKTFDCAWNGGVKWMYSSSLMRVKVLENMSHYKVKQAVKKKPWNPRIIPGTDMTAVYLEKCVWDLWLEKIILLTQLSSEPVAMKRPHGEMAAEHGWQRFTWFSYRRVHLEERCMWKTVTCLFFDCCLLIYLYVPMYKWYIHHTSYILCLCILPVKCQSSPQNIGRASFYYQK